MKHRVYAMQCHTAKTAQKLSIYNGFKNNSSSEIDWGFLSAF